MVSIDFDGMEKKIVEVNDYCQLLFFLFICFCFTNILQNIFCSTEKSNSYRFRTITLSLIKSLPSVLLPNFRIEPRETSIFEKGKRDKHVRIHEKARTRNDTTEFTF